MRFRGNPVWVRCDAEGRPISRGGRVEMRYKADGGKVYRAALKNLSSPNAEPPPDPPPSRPDPPGPHLSPPKALRKVPVTCQTVVAYTDGACSGNPGLAGLGVVLELEDFTVEYREPLGPSTNNAAELMAILRALQLLDGRPRSVVIRTDSDYSIGVLTRAWKPKKNLQIIGAVKDVLARQSVRFEYVTGHKGVEGNERADLLARMALSAQAVSQSTRTSHRRTNR